MTISPHAIQVMLVDSNTLFRAGIARLLETQPDIRVVGETSDCLEAVRLAPRLNPDVLLLEVQSSGWEAGALIKLFRQQFPSAHLVILTTEIDPDSLLSSMLAGASGCLQKNITPDELFARLRGLVKGEAAMSLTTVATLVRRLNSSNCSLCLRASPAPNLTPRECEVLRLVARGMTNRSIGDVLGISEHTVRNHLCSIYQKLNLKNRLQVAVYSVTHGLVDISSVS
jgi:two-component system NarL family response regulator